MTQAAFRALGATLVLSFIAVAVPGQEPAAAIEAAGDVQSYLSVTNLGTNPDSSPADLVSTPIGLFFSADDGLHGRELWVYEPELSEARLVKDIRFGADGAAPKNMIWFKNHLYFTADDGIHDRELWRSDGTAEGTRLFIELAPKGFAASDPEKFRVCGDRLFFLAQTPEYGREPWSTDGTVEGTQLLRDVHAGGKGSLFVIPDAARAGQLFLGTRKDNGLLWVTDGTPEEFRPLPTDISVDIDYHGDMIFAGPRFLIMSAYGPSHREPFVLDYATEEISLLKDIHPELGSDASLFISYGAHVYFQAKDGVHGAELWRTDGTEAGTELFYDICPGAASSSPFQFEVAAGVLCFTARDGVHGREVWVTDGTREGTRLLKDVNPGIATAEPYQLTAFGESLAFSADHEELGEELWLSDGTPQGTRPVKDIHAGPGDAEPYYLTVHDGLLYFSARDDVYGAELWRTDGTAEGTRLAADIARPYTPPPSSEPFGYESFGNTFIFFAKDSPAGWRLYRSDGTEQGTFALDASPVIKEKRDCMARQSAGDLAWYVVRDQGENVLWQVTAGSGGVRRVGRLGAIREEAIGTLTNNGFYCSGWDDAHGTEPWRVEKNGNRELVADLNPGPPGSGPHRFVSLSGKTMCIGETGNGQTALWSIDAQSSKVVKTWPVSSAQVDMAAAREFLVISVIGETEASFWHYAITDDRTTEVTFENGAPLAARSLTATDNAVYFAGYRPETGTELWRIDLEQNRGGLLHDAYPGPASGNPSLIGTENSRLFYITETPAYGVEIWSTHGTRESTHVFTELYLGAGSGSPANVILDNDMIIGFGTYEDENFNVSRQLFVTRLDDELLILPVHSLGPEVTVDESAGLATASNRVIFTATDPIHGAEPWVGQPGHPHAVMLKDLWSGASALNAAE